MAVLIAITGGGVYLGSAVVARHRAQASADLASLAAVGALADGVDAACALASTVARRMSTAMTRCSVDGLDVTVAVDATASLGAFGTRPARAVARAGPVDVTPRDFA